MKTEILNDLKKINDNHKRVAEFRNLGAASLVLSILIIVYIPDHTWKISTSAVTLLVSAVFFAQSRRSVNITIDEDKRKYLGLTRDLAPASHSGLGSKTLPETTEYQNREPRFKNIVQIPTVPVRVNEPNLTPRALKDPFDRDNFNFRREETIVTELRPASPDVSNRIQDSSFMSPISSPRRRRSGSFSNINANNASSGDRGHNIQSIFRTAHQAPVSTSSALNTPAKSFHEQMAAMTTTLATTINNTPKGSAVTYQPSPATSPYLMKHDARQRLHKLSPVPTVSVVSKSYYSTSYDVISEVSATSWLGLNEVPDEWSESFRFVLGRYLHEQLNLFDNVVDEIFTQISLKTAGAGPSGGGISPADLVKARRLLELEEEKLQLSNGTSAGADEVLDYCRNIGINPALIHRYDLCLTLFRMPSVLDGSNSSRNTPTSLPQGGLSPFPSAASAGGIRKNKDTVQFLKRLRDLAANCPDGRLRITSAPLSATLSKFTAGFFSGSSSARPGTDSTYSPTKKSSELSDQDIVMLLFLHKCDFHNTIWSRSIELQHRFSSKHFVNCGSDLNQVVKAYFTNCHTQAQLNQQLALAPKAILFRTSQSNNHFDVCTMSPYAEIIKLDENRNDCFESIIVFLLVVYKTLALEHAAKNGNESSANSGVNSHGMFALGTSGGINVSVVKDLLQDIFNTKEEIADYLNTAYGLKLVETW